MKLVSRCLLRVVFHKADALRNAVFLEQVDVDAGKIIIWKYTDFECGAIRRDQSGHRAVQFHRFEVNLSEARGGAEIKLTVQFNHIPNRHAAAGLGVRTVITVI